MPLTYTGTSAATRPTVQVGDLVRHRWDPESPDYIYQVVRYSANYTLEGIGARTTVQVKVSPDDLHTWVFVRRPAPDEVIYSRRLIHPRTGISLLLPPSAEALTEMHAEVVRLRAEGREPAVEVVQFWLHDTDVWPHTLQNLFEVVSNIWELAGANLCALCVSSGLFKSRGSCTAHIRCETCGIFTNRCQHCVGYGYRSCAACCEYALCSCGCNVFFTDVCPSCQRIPAHGCHCPRCDAPSCNKGGGSPCCGRCKRHCACRLQCFPLIKNTFKMFYSPRGDKMLRRHLGTELEILGSESFSPRLRKAVKDWHANITTDSSIGASCIFPPHLQEANAGKERVGMELVTAPAAGSMWLKMIAEIGEGLAESKAFVGNSCGQHVHVNAKDIDVWGISRLIRLYAHVEETLFEALPVDRLNSNFTRRCGEKYLGWLKDDSAKLRKRMTKEMFARKLYGLTPTKPRNFTKKERLAAAQADKIEIQMRAERKYDGTRYNALNLHSYWHRGTVEFRHAHGTANPKQIMEWGLVCGHIVDFAVRGTESQLRAALSAHPRDTMRKFLNMPSPTIDWLQERWDKFTIAAGTRRGRQPQQDPKTGEV